jgi:hypothetical protein
MFGVVFTKHCLSACAMHRPSRISYAGSALRLIAAYLLDCGIDMGRRNMRSEPVERGELLF